MPKIDESGNVVPVADDKRAEPQSTTAGTVLLGIVAMAGGAALALSVSMIVGAAVFGAGLGVLIRAIRNR